MRLPAGRGPPQRAHLIAGGVSRPSAGQPAGRHTRLAAGRGPMHLIAGAVYARHGGQRAAADSESGARAGPRFTVTLSTAAGGPQRTPSQAPGPGPRSHCHTQHGGQWAAADSESGARVGAPTPLSAGGRAPWPAAATTSRSGPAAGPRLRLSAGPGRSPVSGAVCRRTPCRRCRQSGRRGPAVRQVWGTDSDTSRRRRGRRSRPEPRAAGPARHDFPRARFVRVQSARGPRLPVCLDVARPSHLHLPPFPAPRVKHVIPLHPPGTL